MRQKRVRALRKKFLTLVKNMSIPEKQHASFWKRLKRGHNESSRPKMPDARPKIKAKIARSNRRKKKNAELAAS